MDKIKVMIENRQKEVKIPTGLRLLVRRTCNAVLTMEKFQGSAEISVSFVNDQQIRELNASSAVRTFLPTCFPSLWGKGTIMRSILPPARKSWETSSSLWSTPWTRPAVTAILCSGRWAS